MKVLYISFNGFYEYNGISKKKLAQIKGLKESGCNVVNCYYSVDPTDGQRLWMINDNVLISLGTGIRAKIKKRINYVPILAYIEEKQISFVYMRSEHNANPFLIHFVRQLRNKGVKVVMEIPTYPYDQEYITFESKCSLFIDKLFRKSLAKQLNAIVTFSDQVEIFRQRTIRISNGIDFSSIKLKQNNHKQSELHLIGVAEIHYWHGFDRVVAGMRDYYKSKADDYKVFFHIIGEFSGERERIEILPLITENQLENYVILHGRLFGTALDEIFDHADIGIGSLARHRSNITYIKTLKNREYAARGIPFIYSEIDEDFEEMPYIMKVPADESPINIEPLIEFYRENRWNPIEIRESVAHLSWKNQMQKILDTII
ncbi:glycosyltransferase family 1 protein [Proteiniphilum sp.]|uniref:glycosyltransferase family 1 protein n=1 Tax=Proteiniphilum sp. TaxID=1926877 RepID=UPI002B213574|nr:glycosyltransferase family 1 protein [Proteiniphilum sp.]MEA4915953.1 glycosyltransferase family 1 protein [Proteiniphilum sp.]